MKPNTPTPTTQWAQPPVAYAPESEARFDNPKNINYGRARVIYAMPVAYRPMGWVMPGGLRTTDYAQAFACAVRLDALLTQYGWRGA